MSHRMKKRVNDTPNFDAIFTITESKNPAIVRKSQRMENEWDIVWKSGGSGEVITVIMHLARMLSINIPIIFN